MKNFISILENTKVALSDYSIMNTDQYVNIKGSELLRFFKTITHGNKDGSHFIRATLKTSENGKCLSRSNTNLNNLAEILIIDCDKRINDNGEEIEGAPEPYEIHSSLKANNIGHVIYGTHSHYEGSKGNRYRIILATNKPYSIKQLTPTVEEVVLSINQNLKEELLACAKENNVFAQGWYFPRKPLDSEEKHLYFEYLDGLPVYVLEPLKIPPTSHYQLKTHQFSTNHVSAIHYFNKQHQLTDLLSQYGYQRKFFSNTHEKWLSPDSKSGKPGITVKDNKFYSHHNDLFNDGYWHDAFDLMRIRDGLSQSEAVKKVLLENLNLTFDADTSMIIGNPDEIKPLPLPESLPTVLPLTAEMLPESIGGFIFDVAKRQQSAPDFIAVAAIVGLSGLVGRKALIYPKQSDDWLVTPNQWGAIIGRPSAMKSPSMKEALWPLRQLDTDAAKNFEEARKKYEEELQLIELVKNVAKKNAKAALTKNGRDAAREALKISEDIKPPLRKRLVVNDSTIEKLGELLKENSNGLILVRDELSGWLTKLSKEEYQSDRAFYLECFDGNGSYIYDRIGRGTVEIKNCTLSVIGGIQPSKIAYLVRDAIRGICDDGLIQRLQFAVWPDDIGDWKWSDIAPNQIQKERYLNVFIKLYHFNMDLDEPKYFRFMPESQELFASWMTELQTRTRCSNIHPALESHMLKMPQTIAGLALLFELIDGNGEYVGVIATQRALKWAEYLLSHANRLYSLGGNQALDGAKLILKRKEQLPNPFSLRDIQRKGWTGLDSGEIISEALNWLIDYVYLIEKRYSTFDTNGRPKIQYQWNEFMG
jgi:hypothetical protein